MNACLQGVAADVGIAACETFAGQCDWSYYLLSSNTQAGGFVVRRVIDSSVPMPRWPSVFNDIFEVIVEWCVVNHGEPA